MKFKINTPEIKFAKDQQTIEGKALSDFQKNINALLKELDKSVNKKEELSERTYIMNFMKSLDYNDVEFGYEKDKIDLLIKVDDKIEVLFETKSSNETRDMVSIDNLNVKPLHQIIYYFMQERLSGNNSLKNLVITNGYNWYVFDAEDFNNIFFKNKELLKYFNESHTDQSVQNFYNNVAKPFIENSDTELKATHFNLQDYKDKKTSELKSLFKLLSSASLLKKKVKIDSNKLNAKFFKELLYIMGLEEQKDGSKKLIKEKKKTDEGSLLENVKAKIESHGTLDDFKDKKDYGNTYEQQLYETSLELVLTWINRLLFLKLLEGQLVACHNNDENYRFLSYNKVTEFDILDTIFFEVLNSPVENRKTRITERYPYIPYLNSSLFEPSDLEKNLAFIAGLKDNLTLPLMAGTVLSNEDEKELPTLDYLLKFLEAYNFASHTEDDMYAEKGELINASVLGLVFEKINGYKDGSFFTPGFITEYMARETIRRAVIQKFNDKYNLKLKEFSSLKNYITAERNHSNTNNLEYNAVINSLKIIDPAVGSGHFLVSSLNEIIAIKSELNILADENGELLNCVAKIDNDSIVITQNNLLFNYTLDTENKIITEKNKIQKAIFQEKKTIIENCLFGVDINPKSVKITQLRLWIELLKNAYYKDEENLETLPNIDINIKIGNSLISRFQIVNGTKKLTVAQEKQMKLMTQKYKDQVIIYKSTTDRTTKKNATKQIQLIKTQFSGIANPNDADYAYIRKLRAEIGEMPFIFNKKEQKDWKKQLKIKTKILEKKELDYKNKLETLYSNAFEWRFEFPEVLDVDGKFSGFDIVIGNPPYIKEYEGKEIFDGLRDLPCYQGKMDIWYLFACLGTQILKKDALLSFIATNNWITNSGAKKFRNQIANNTKLIQFIDFSNYMIFEEASVQTMIMMYQNNVSSKVHDIDYREITSKTPTINDVKKLLLKEISKNNQIFDFSFDKRNFTDKPFTFNNPKIKNILSKLESNKNKLTLDDKKEVAQGMVLPQDYVINSTLIKLNEKEVANGIHPHHDYVSNKMLPLLNKKFKKGQGIFALSTQEKEKLNLNENENKLIKPYFTSKNFSKYYADSKNTEWIIYTGSEFKNKEKIKLYPNIKKHLDKFKKVITSDNKPYGLHRARKEEFFKGEKIIVQRKCPTEPIFTYTDFDCYVSATFYVIKTNNVNQKYLTALLNSKLIAFWLRYKGKMQGNNYQIDKEPILNIPLIQVSEKEENQIITKVEKILTLKKEDSNADTSKLEAEIDKMVYQLYELTPEEIKIVEESVK